MVALRFVECPAWPAVFHDGYGSGESELASDDLPAPTPILSKRARLYDLRANHMIISAAWGSNSRSR